MLQELPSCLRTELAVNINVDFIQSVKLFQLSDSSFIIALISHMKPFLCLAGDYIVRKGEIADCMYFIKKGMAKVLCADDESVVIAYLGEGCYFGEIGVLLTGKRSVSVVAQTDCVLYTIDKQTLVGILNDFENHKIFLESVGQQRIKTTFLKDLLPEETLKPRSNNLARLNTLPNAPAKPFSITPYSYAHALFSFILCLAILWNVCYTFFAICFDDVMKDPLTSLIVIDTLAYTVCVCDIPFKFYLADTT